MSSRFSILNSTLTLQKRVLEIGVCSPASPGSYSQPLLLFACCIYYTVEWCKKNIFCDFELFFIINILEKDLLQWLEIRPYRFSLSILFCRLFRNGHQRRFVLCVLEKTDWSVAAIFSHFFDHIIIFLHTCSCSSSGSMICRDDENVW